MDANDEDVKPATTALARTSSPANLPASSPSNLPGKNPAADTKVKGKKRKSEAADKQPKAAGEEGTPAKKKKKSGGAKKPGAGDKKTDGEGSKTPAANEDKDKAGGQEGDGDGEKDPKDEAEEEEEDDENDDLATDDKYKEMQEQRNILFQSQLKSDADWHRYTAMRRANLNDKETKALIASIADVPESQLKAPIIFTIKGMAKVLVGQLVDNARLVRREWGEDDTDGEPLQPRHIHESYRRMMRQGAIPPNTTQVSPFSFRR
mmetsp:Transcript_38509/g.62084  ORF Transcript_38509/g.62084 Transcript_38509/m.62084 type:complete len:263 (-) Transcript_38509:77-865(-)|eukprot:CAMPEP_0179431870 /NCGR_PEP_ID=MMETSP0799-20121207/16651_1 /TAXON_ID=46947 /ORGANISM="Geminigera cryophila, Strain CCMP2564" /LENGTH=262 /DNA_ID=CAMNT_0021209015 /DNA_START=44 /DNA_END=832 /DNA_ORIENTATION=+